MRVFKITPFSIKYGAKVNILTYTPCSITIINIRDGLLAPVSEHFTENYEATLNLASQLSTHISEENLKLWKQLVNLNKL